ncbi:MAG: hypothetical protein ABIM44_02755 [candidate division WOR-3 bacterium]
MTGKQIVKILALTAIILQIVLLIYSLLYIKGNGSDETFIVFLRISLLVGSGMMVILTRYFLRLSSFLKNSRGIILVQVISILPAIIIPAGGFIFAFWVKDGGEYLLFFFIGLYHLVRYYSPIINMGGAI